MTDGPPSGPGGRESTTHPNHAGAIGPGAAVSAGMVVFALAAHAHFPLFLVALAGLALTATALASSLTDALSRRPLFGLTGFSREVGGWMVAGVVLGIALAFMLRFTSNQSLLLAGLEPFVLTAMAIGAMEELLFRGFIQGRFATLGWWAAISLAALAHTAYKVALFTFPPGAVEVRLDILGFFTFVVGLLMGLMRHRSGSVLPPLAAHVAFDVFVYGDWVAAPWWIWS